MSETTFFYLLLCRQNSFTSLNCDEDQEVLAFPSEVVKNLMECLFMS